MVIDGIDFAAILHFPRILGAITASLQPPRLILGLFMVVLLVTAGRIWDSATTPTISPNGLLHGDWSAAEQAVAQRTLQDIFRSDYVRDRHRDGLDLEALPKIDARRLLRQVEEGYRYRRISFDDLSPEEIRERDEAYLAVVDQINLNRPLGDYEATAQQVVASFNQIIGAVLAIDPAGLGTGIMDLMIRTPAAIWSEKKPFAILFGLLILITLTVGGGALSRMAACQFAGQERMRISDAVDFALGNWIRLVATPAIPLIYAGIGCVVIIVLGSLMTVPWLDVVGGILYGIAMLVALLVALILVGFICGVSLLMPAVACENCDAGDAAQRGYAYTTSRPMHLLGYGLTAIIGLVLGFLLISLIAVLTLNMTASLFGTLTGNSAISAAGGFELLDLTRRDAGAIHLALHNRAAAWFVTLWETLMVSLVSGYVFVYFFSASTRVYLLMRRAADGQDIEEIWRPGLVPGTLAPIPEATVTDHTGVKATAQDDPGVAQRTARRLVAWRYSKGGGGETDQSREAQG